MKKYLKLGIAFIAAGATLGTAVSAVTPTFAKENQEVTAEIHSVGETYYGEKIVSGTTTRGKNFMYSDGVFNTESKYYNPHMATASCMLAQASDMIYDDNCTHGADDLVDLYKKMGFTNIYVSDSYKKKPTVDSIGCVVASKVLSNGKKVVSITMRSAGYGAEWASNVTLGTEGEAKGFASARDKVIDYFNEYVSKYELDDDLNSGNVKFWIVGFSRGGATANLTAKTLVDKYQVAGNEMYAYCIEAPRGGVKEMINAERDYDGIHNVINNNDIVTYVAPRSMGFIRYGVDHYLIGDAADYSKVEFQKKIYDAEFSDNHDYREGTLSYKQQKELFIKQAKLSGCTYMPYEATGYRINYDDISLEKTSSHNVTDYINSVFTDKLGKTTTRIEYSMGGYEQAAINLLSFTNNTNVGIGDIVDVLTEGKSLYDLIPIWQVVKAALPRGYVVSTGNIFKDVWNVFFNRDEIKIILKFNGDDIENISNGFVDNLFATKFDPLKIFNMDELKKVVTSEKDLADVLRVGIDLNKFFEKYEGGAAQAKKDARLIVKLALKNVDDPDFVATIAKNLVNIIDNHQMPLTETWLKTYDSWFEDTIYEVEL